MAQQDLELEKFYETDIIEFLDLKKSTNQGQQKSTKMLECLTKNKIPEATSLLKEEIEKYNQLSSKDIYKNITFKTILTFMSQIEQYLNINPENNSLKEIYELIKNSKQLEQGNLEKITVIEELTQKKQQEKEEEQKKQIDFVNKLETKIKDINKEIFVNLRKKDLKNSIKNYKQLKFCFEKYPSQFAEQKKEFYNDLLAVFMQIQKLKKELITRTEEQQQNKELFLKNKKQPTNYIHIDQIKKTIDQIKTDVKNKKFTEATNKVIDLKHLLTKMPEEYKHIRTILEGKIKIITQRIEFVKRMEQQKT